MQRSPKYKLPIRLVQEILLQLVFIAGILKGVPLKEIHNRATEIAAYVCTQKGATPKLSMKIF